MADGEKVTEFGQRRTYKTIKTQFCRFCRFLYAGYVNVSTHAAVPTRPGDQCGVGSRRGLFRLLALGRALRMRRVGTAEGLDDRLASARGRLRRPPRRSAHRQTRRNARSATEGGDERADVKRRYQFEHQVASQRQLGVTPATVPHRTARGERRDQAARARR